jgi:phosphoglycolate phosphatase
MEHNIFIPMKKTKLLLFDIDSTLLKDGGAATDAFDVAFHEMFSLLPARVDKHGKTDPAIAQEISLATIGRVLTEREDRRLHDRYCELYPEFLEKSGEFCIMEGAVELCLQLSSASSFLCGLQTGNLEVSAWAKLTKAKLNAFFHFGGFGSDSSNRAALVKIGIERGLAYGCMSASDADVIVIGDSTLDIQAGIRNNAYTIGVTTGKDSADDLKAAHANAIVTDLTKASGIYEILLHDYFA